MSDPKALVRDEARTCDRKRHAQHIYWINRYRSSVECDGHSDMSLNLENCLFYGRNGNEGRNQSWVLMLSGDLCWLSQILRLETGEVQVFKIISDRLIISTRWCLQQYD